MILRLIFSFVLLVPGLTVAADRATIESILALKEAQYGLPEGFLFTLAEIESGYSPFAVNVDKESFFFNSEEELISSLIGIARNPHMVKVSRGEGHSPTRYFRRSEDSALALIAELAERGLGDQIEYRHLETASTDLCVLQVNFKAHGRRGFDTVNDILDVETCIDYGAGYLSAMIEQHGFMHGVGCYNYCRYDNRHHRAYIERFRQAHVNRTGNDPFLLSELKN